MKFKYFSFLTRLHIPQGKNLLTFKEATAHLLITYTPYVVTYILFYTQCIVENI
jgi:hypothetical protein